MKPLPRLLALSCISVVLLSTTRAQSFFGSDNFNAAGPAFNSSLWSGSGSYFQQANGRAQLININGAYNVDGGIKWPTNANFDASSHAYDWTATVSATLGYDGVNGVPFLGLFAQPQNGRYFGIMLRAGQPSGSANVFSSHTGTLVGASISGSFGTVGLASMTTVDLTDVMLRVSWDSSAGALTSYYSFDGGANYTTSASITVDGSTLGVVPDSGFSLSLYAMSGGVEHPANTMYFDDFAVAAGASAIPEPSTYAALAGAAALGLACWRKRRVSRG